MLIPGAIMMSVGGFALLMWMLQSSGWGQQRASSEGENGKQEEHVPKARVMSFNHNQPIRFKINNPPPGNNAWVGISPAPMPTTAYMMTGGGG